MNFWVLDSPRRRRPLEVLTAHPSGQELSDREQDRREDVNRLCAVIVYTRPPRMVAVRETASGSLWLELFNPEQSMAKQIVHVLEIQL